MGFDVAGKFHLCAGNLALPRCHPLITEFRLPLIFNIRFKQIFILFYFSEEKSDLVSMQPEQFASLEKIKQNIRKDQEQVYPNKPLVLFMPVKLYPCLIHTLLSI